MSARSKPPRPLAHEWLLLVYQLPARPSNIRVRTWRRLLQVGAVSLKNSAYVLPNTPEAKEDFEWIKAEIVALKGQANVLLADHLDAATQEEIASAFQAARQSDFQKIRSETKRLLRAIQRRPATMASRPKLQRRARALRERLNGILSIDFFHAPGHDEAIALLDESEALLARAPASAKGISKGGEKLMVEKFRSRTWVTRPRPGVERMSSAWLIRKFVDPEAKFAFTEKPDGVPGGVPFDMLGVLFGHEGNSCTFETLLRRFSIRGNVLVRIGQIVHNLDLKDERFETPEAIAFGRLIEGLCQIHPDDHMLLEHGMELFEALYRSLTNTPSPKLRRKGSASHIGLS